MLHYEAIDSKTLELLKQLQKVTDFDNLRLVGGSSLALQIGHRKSIDIDLFGIINSDELEISKKLDKIGSVTKIKSSENINIYLIDGIKVDIVNYHYKWLDEPITEDGLVLAKKMDIAAMKLAAITGRGTKKDFIDLYFLLHEYSLEQMLDFYTQKYHDGSTFLVLKSLAYFNDADSEEDPIMLKTMKWTKAKEFIIKKLEIFSTKSD
jgi:Nucleotidyl transferase AbiEii toxin, Type IV TA system